MTHDSWSHDIHHSTMTWELLPMMSLFTWQPRSILRRPRPTWNQWHHKLLSLFRTVLLFFPWMRRFSSSSLRQCQYGWTTGRSPLILDTDFSVLLPSLIITQKSLTTGFDNKIKLDARGRSGMESSTRRFLLSHPWHTTRTKSYIHRRFMARSTNYHVAMEALRLDHLLFISNQAFTISSTTWDTSGTKTPSVRERYQIVNAEQFRLVSWCGPFRL